MSERHREALAHLLYGVQSQGGFILLTGEVGTGKTTVCRCLLEQLPADVDVAFVINPKLSVDELLGTICDEFHIEYEKDASRKLLVDAINDFLLASHKQNRRTVLIIDEAQNLSVEVLEQLRLLTNLETNERKLLQIILLGQPELQQLLARQELRQLSQRVTARFHLQALSRAEVGEYIYHRLEVAGCKQELFPNAVINRIFRISEGIPRVINLICDRALLGAYSENKSQVSLAILTKAAEEVLGPSAAPVKQRSPIKIVLAIAFVGLIASIWFVDKDQNPESDMLQSDSQSTINKSNSGLPSGFQTDPPPAKPDITELLSSKNQENLEHWSSISRNIKGDPTTDTALRKILNIWGNPPIKDSEPACGQVSDLGLSCYTAIGNLQDIRSLNRPVAINLAPSDPAPNGPSTEANWVALVHIEAGTAILWLNESEYRISESLLANWQGEYIVLWRMPPGYQAPVSEGSEGATVEWLASQLSAFDGLPLIPTSAIFDASLTKRVQAFQRSVNLETSGVVGPETWIHLNSIEGIGVPFLTANTATAVGGEE